MRTNELSGTALDWAVAKCEGVVNGGDLDVGFIAERGYTPSTDWAQGGAIIERERLTLRCYKPALWDASIGRLDYVGDGTTPLIAAMRCYVASKLGDNVELPEELK
jgi:hypothetical protein